MRSVASRVIQLCSVPSRWMAAALVGMLIWPNLSLAGSEPLLLDSTVESSPVSPGQQFFWTATVGNSSAVDTLSSVMVELRIPQGVDAVSDATISQVGGAAGCAGPSCEPDEVYSVDFGEFAPGESRQIRGYLVVSDTTLPGTTIPLAFSASHTTVSSVVSSDSSVDVVLNNALRVDVAATENPVSPGGDMTYVVTYGNQGLSTANNVSLTLDLPGGVEFISADFDGALVDQTVTWDLGSVPAGDGFRRQVAVRDTTMSAGSLLTAEAQIMDGTGTGSDDRSGITVAVGSPQITIATAVETDPLSPDEQFYWTATIANPSSVATLADTEIILRVPEGIAPFFDSIVSVGGGTGGCSGPSCEPNEFYVASLGELGPGQSRQIRGYLTMPSDLAPGSTPKLLFQARHADQSLNIHQYETVVVGLDSDLRVELSSTQNPVSPSGEMTYVVTYGNRGLVAANNVTLSLTLPEGLEFLAADLGGTLADQTVTWDLGTLPAGQGFRRHVMVRDTTSTVGSLLTAEAQIMDQAGSAPDDRAALTVAVDNPLIDLVAVVEADPVAPTEQFFWAATIGNASSVMTLTDAEIILRIPEFVEPFSDAVVSLDGATGGCSGPTCEPNELSIIDLGDLAPGESRSVRGFMTLPSDLAPGTISKLAFQARHTELTSIVQRQEMVITGLTSNLRVELASTENPLPAGGEMSYVLSFGNRGLASASDVTLSLDLPDDVAFQEASDGGVFADGTVTWSLASVPAGFGDQLEVSVRDTGATTGRLLLAEGRIIDGVGTTDDDRALLSVPIAAPIIDFDLVIESDPVVPDEQYFWNATLRNTSNVATLTDASVTLRIPLVTDAFSDALVAVQGGTGGCSGSTCDANEVFVADFGELGPGAVTTLRGPLTVNATVAQGTIVRMHAQARATTPLGVDRVRSIRDSVSGTLLSSDVIFKDGFE